MDNLRITFYRPFFGSRRWDLRNFSRVIAASWAGSKGKQVDPASAAGCSTKISFLRSSRLIWQWPFMQAGWGWEFRSLERNIRMRVASCLIVMPKLLAGIQEYAPCLQKYAVEDWDVNGQRWGFLRSLKRFPNWALWKNISLSFLLQVQEKEGLSNYRQCNSGDSPCGMNKNP